MLIKIEGSLSSAGSVPARNGLSCGGYKLIAQVSGMQHALHITQLDLTQMKVHATQLVVQKHYIVSFKHVAGQSALVCAHAGTGSTCACS